VFLAKEFGARVWAVDLWEDPSKNWGRVVEAGAGERVCPIRAEAHALPFADGFFDAAVSVDAYEYFGTDELYLAYLSRFVKKGGLVGVVVPGLVRELPRGRVPAHLTRPQSNGKVFWEPECCCFKSVAWWRSLWERSGKVNVLVADTMPDGWRHWRDFELAVEKAGLNVFPTDAEALDADRGRTVGLVRLVAESRGPQGFNLYEPGLLSRVERG
jgi:SAM-dependent methyltransferase